MINKANLKKRLAFAAVAVPVAFVIVSSKFSLSALALRLLGLSADSAPAIYPGQILALVIVMFGAFEYIRMLSAANKVNAFWLGYVWIFVMSAADLLNYSIPAPLSNSVLLMMVAFEAFFFGGEAQFGRWKRASLFFTGMIFLNIASISMMSLYNAPFQQLFNSPTIWAFGFLDVVIVITATFLCDTAAYFAGSTIGKRRFSSISPNKTIEGSVAGLGAAMLVMSVCWIFIRNPEYPLFLGPILGLIIGVTAQTGDLLVSLIKRYFRVKDASTIIPGHGGILDRFDSLFFTAPVLCLFAWLLVRWYS
ncbi:MAG: phosphatidate cytidylyltransferase [Chitinispirillales bacterium]|jgi:phosphatidate cytidylyltransferase|nr:phosphatidate cytidylyltransferase [Chitinispirillales bacterium]